jgi:hypothetical protein
MHNLHTDTWHIDETLEPLTWYTSLTASFKEKLRTTELEDDLRMSESRWQISHGSLSRAVLDHIHHFNPK